MLIRGGTRNDVVEFELGLEQIESDKEKPAEAIGTVDNLFI